MNSPTWLKPVDAARRLSISTRDLYRLIDEGRLPAYKFGPIIRLLAIDVEEFRRRQDEEER
jgi:excisionase family DNA binding protein